MILSRINFGLIIIRVVEGLNDLAFEQMKLQKDWKCQF